MLALFVRWGFCLGSTECIPSGLGGDGWRETWFCWQFEQITYLNSVVMPDEVESDSEEDEGEGEDDDDGEDAESSGAGDETES
jgi:hypothetical protein